MEFSQLFVQSLDLQLDPMRFKFFLFIHSKSKNIQIFIISFHCAFVRYKDSCKDDVFCSCKSDNQVLQFFVLIILNNDFDRLDQVSFVLLELICIYFLDNIILSSIIILHCAFAWINHHFLSFFKLFTISFIFLWGSTDRSNELSTTKKRLWCLEIHSCIFE